MMMSRLPGAIKKKVILFFFELMPFANLLWKYLYNYYSYIYSSLKFGQLIEDDE